jgi:hypothetical protein
MRNRLSNWLVVAAIVTAAGCAASVDAPSTAPTAPATPPKTPAPANDTTASWTFCVNAGNVCTFLGLRAVRLADATGTKAVVQTAYHSVPCAVYGFNDQNPAPNKALHCDYGRAKMTTLAIPIPMGPLTGSSVVVPMGSAGSATQDVQSGAGDGVPTDGSGSFRTTCSLAKMDFIDPIVFPGQRGASHLHAFFGNVAIDATTTASTIATAGNSTCRGGILNRTAYWTPAVIDTKTGNAVLPDEATIYYKTGYNMNPANVQPMPTGLRIIAGDKNAMAAQFAGPLQLAEWSCRDAGGSGDGATIPVSCPAGDAVRLTIIFPQCWDGKNLDSPDHKSHMAYPIYSSAGRFASKCPATHPVMLPELTEHFDYPIANGQQSAPAGWRLSSDMYDASKKGGLSAHADWMMGWDPATMSSLAKNCLAKGLDCGVGGIGAGRALF